MFSLPSTNIRASKSFKSPFFSILMLSLNLVTFMCLNSFNWCRVIGYGIRFLLWQAVKEVFLKAVLIALLIIISRVFLSGHRFCYTVVFSVDLLCIRNWILHIFADYRCVKFPIPCLHWNRNMDWMTLPWNCRGAGLLDTKGSGDVFCLLLNAPPFPCSPVFSGAGLVGSFLVIKPLATGKGVLPLPSFKWVRRLCILGLGSHTERTSD